jgi:hypothetical protein
MTAPTWTRGQADEIEPLRRGSLEAQASIALKALAVINVAGIILAMFPPPLPASLLQALVFNAAAALLAAIEIVVARAVDRRRPWAVAVARPMLVVLIAEGIGAMLVGYNAGIIRLPFESAIAIWALVARPDSELVRRFDRLSGSLVTAAVLAIATMLVVQPVFGWGGVLDVRKADIRTSISADCSAAGGDLPATIRVTFDWSWVRTSPLPNGLDIIVIGWSGKDAAGRVLYLFDKDPKPGQGIYSARREYPSIDMATLVAKESPASWTWGVELGEQGLRPGRIELMLARARDAPPGPQPLSITASYVHLGLWRSDPVSVTCTW